ncbi:MAG: SIR2 family protein [Acidimicrobiaceae bacterium]|nr:SIR2 family protein [Acidimicrobiaceae bacterium]
MPTSPSVQLASSVHAGPGVYALLIGSGVSVAAGVPSGTQVACELIERLATTLGEDTAGDPFGWYRDHSGAEPDYRSLLDEIAPSSADRRNLLSGHFEPSNGADGDRSRAPTRAHRSIARLVTDGFAKVIVTTNFDRLLETALTDAGVDAQVISSAAHAAGAQPLVHSACTIIKVNGDYLSPELKNTAEELDSYEPDLAKLLTQVFDEYGLVVCGWSAQLDAALRAAILSTPSRRYSTYWMDRGNLTEEAEDLVRHRQAIRVPIADADSAFEQIVDTVAALSEAADRQPQDTAAAVERLKLYMPDPVHSIRLHDLIVEETDRLIEAMSGWPVADVDVNVVYPQWLRQYEEASARLMSLLAAGAYFSKNEEHDQLWAKAIDPLANREVTRGGLTVLIEMQQYPTLLALYALALGAAAANRIDPIARVLAAVTTVEYDEALPAAWSVHGGSSVTTHCGRRFRSSRTTGFRSPSIRATCCVQ